MPVIDPLGEPRPAFQAAEAANLLEAAYGLSGELLPLHSERDVNFLVVDSIDRKFVVKLHNPADSEDVVEMQTSALAHVGRTEPTLPICRSVPGIDGRLWYPVTASDGRASFMRLFSFLEGHNPAVDELNDRDLFEWGRTVARLGRALRGFFHHAARYEIQWDVRRAPALRERLDHLGRERQKLVTEVLDRFDARVVPRIDRLRAQVIHNDMSRENVLVDQRRRVTGITDFGDMTHTALICDLAVAVADVLNGRKGSLELAGPMIAGYHAETPLEGDELAILGDLVAARCATDIAVTSWRQQEHVVTPPSAEGALRFLEQMRDEGFDQVAERFAGAAEDFPGSGWLPYRQRPTGELVTARRRRLGSLSLSYESPLHLVRGEGVFLFGPNGERYLDAYNNVPVVGHCHPDVVRAVAAQMGRLNTNTRYLNETSVELAERLVDSAPGHFDRVLFVNSGSEANDIAWRIARFATGHRGAIVTQFAYHGITEATTDLSPEGWPPGFVPSRTRLAAPPRTERSSKAAAETGPDHVEMDVATAIEDLLSAGIGPAAMFVDPAFTSDGILGPANAWVREAAAAVRSAGGLFIADEVQAGFGRTGDDLWSIAAAGVDPDLITVGKPMGNGFPVAAVMTRSEIVDRFIKETGYFSTFGGNTVACVAALAVLRVIEEESLVEHVRSVGDHLLGRLREVGGRHDSVGEVRAWGLVAGMEIVSREDGCRPDSEEANRVTNRLKDLGILVGTTGPADNVLKIRPPLVVEAEHVDLLTERLDEALGGTKSVG
jgi:4-aminobutyrate aminotransferase-like enzyme/Ser/Thr protein kinase RdoA (MazF antagonist)